jgi:hemerythrin
MTLIEWKDSYSVGVKIIDEQHKKLFSLINDLYSAMKAGKEKEILSKVLDDLARYVDVHFYTEEKYFADFGYEKKNEQIAQHKMYAEKIRSFQEGLQKNQDFLSFAVTDFLEDWILNHVTGEDKKYTKCFNEHGLN